MPLPLANVEHQLPGRVRLRVPSRQRDAPFFATIEVQLRTAAPVHRVRANPHTASVVIEYDGDLEAVVTFARERGLVDVVPTAAPPTPRRPGGSRRRRHPVVDSLSIAAAALIMLGLYR